MPKVTILYKDKKQQLSVPSGITLLQLLQRHGYAANSLCNGNGVCGKCRVQVHTPIIPYTQEERKHLSQQDMRMGIHLSCRVKVQDDMEISPGSATENASILTEANTAGITLNPVLQKKACILPSPALDDQQADADRICLTCSEKTLQAFSFPGDIFHGFDLEMLRQIPGIIRESGHQVTTLNMMGRIIGIEAGHTAEAYYGVAIDIGTTTVAAYLYNLNNGSRLSVASMLNPQKKYGADVISRIDHASKSSVQAAEMAELICSAINELIEVLVQRKGLEKRDVYLVTIAANTTMLHLLLQLPAIQLARAPFVPVTVSTLFIKPRELSMNINPQGNVILLPGVSAYVGADTTAAVLSTGMYHGAKASLLVDIGTNGEIVLGSKDFLIACSTAAGPAFEGANISCGTGGIEGAISEVTVDNAGELKVKTIGDQKAIGICGSGLIDAIACMLQIGILDETGRILGCEELDDNALKYADRLITVYAQPAFSLIQTNDATIYITQKDVREVQSAKAAIAAGIAILIREAGLKTDDIHSVFLAGGFGSYMRIGSAAQIGLLPKVLKDRMMAVGNAAGAGAIRSLLCQEELIQTASIAKRIKYLELSSRQDFVLEYTNQMLFGMD